ncbi:MAG: hypothetical protein NUV90_00015 [Candidatus Parcubacteria bacterium]|nr:hypothetical protein [Candidatus Parcubacteria bacterium]
MEKAVLKIAGVMVIGFIIGIVIDHALGINSTTLHMWLHDTYTFFFGVAAALVGVSALRK